MAMLIFKIQIRDGGTGKNYVDECLKDKRITTHIDFAKELIESLRPGDVGIVHKGSKAVCLVKVLYKITNPSEVKGTSFGHDFRVEILQYFKDLPDNFPLKKQGKNVGHNGTYTLWKTNSDKPVYQFITSWYNLIKAKMQKQEIRTVLEYKKQIILQGPPGTGKTYNAEEIAREMTANITVSNPNQSLDEFYKNFDSRDQQVIEARNDRNDLRAKFLASFPKENLKNLTLEEYCLGTGERDNFCWWIERGLKELGYYFPGSARAYRIYWSKKNESYDKNGALNEIDSDEEAMTVVAENLNTVVVKKDYKTGAKFFGNSFILKLLNTYYPDEFVPVNSLNYMKNALALFKIDTTELDFVQMNKRLMQLHDDKNQEFNKDVRPHEFMRFLVENFNLKDGEKIEAEQIISKGSYEVIQFHPAYSYDDFVRGIVADVEDNEPNFRVENKILADFAERATNNSKGKFVLIIDEINRANLPAVLGELIYALEYRGKLVNTPYELDGERRIKLPDNLYIIGTMNTADRSVGHIDYAIRRRFSFISMLPDESVVPEFAKQKFNEVSALFSKQFLSTDFKKDDVQIGHSYFMAEDENELKIKIKYEVIPILKEYVKDGVLNNEATPIINTL